jgi:NitT/TauT family transport system substrate-binding protein
MRALEAVDLDMAYIGMPPVYHAYDDGLHLKIVAKVNYGQAALITRHDSDIKTLADLRNKRIASVRKGSGMDILLRGFVLKEYAGLDPQRDVNIVTMPAKIMQASVQRGLVDAAFTWEPYVSQAVIADNARVLFDVNEKLPHYPWYVLVATESMTHAKRDAMLRVLKAHKQAIDFLNDSPDAGAKILVEKFHLDNVITAAGSRKEAVDIVHQARMRLGWECKFQQADVIFLQRLINYSKELGYLKQSIKAEDLLDQDAIDSLIKE